MSPFRPPVEVAPAGIALGPDGSLYVAEPSRHRVRVIDDEGTITTFAGTGTANYTGDDSAASAATRVTPSSRLRTSR